MVASSSDLPPVGRPVFAGQGTTIFSIMSALAVQYGAINLGQGFPDEDGPPAIRRAAAEVLLRGPNQYPPMRGVIELRRAIANHAQQFYGLVFDPETQVLVTSGATEALAASLAGLTAPGDEVVLIEPAYDSYRPVAELVGTAVRSLRLEPPYWRLTEEALNAVLSPRTKLLVINTPLNPVGRVFDAEELSAIANAVQRTGAYIVCDEVYEHLVFDGRRHIPLMTMPDLMERTVRVGSAGKMFSLTGWKVGWVSGPARLIDLIAKAHQFLTFTTPPALQLGIAHGFSHEMAFPVALTAVLQGNRDLLCTGLSEIGFAVVPSEGTYFLAADISGLTNEPDRVFCERLTREAGVATIPLSAFFSGGGPDHFIRFAFCKKRSVIEEALSRLRTYFSKSPSNRTVP